MTFKEAIKIINEQEELLQFNSFSHDDAWNLGMILSRNAKNCGFKSTIVSIRLSNGANIFQYMSGDCPPLSEKWIGRKERSVKLTGHTSLLLNMRISDSDGSMAGEGLDEVTETLYGGGFPIYVKGTGVVGVILCSGLEQDIREHNLIVKSVSEYLGIEIPMLDSEAVYTK